MSESFVGINTAIKKRLVSHIVSPQMEQVTTG